MYGLSLQSWSAQVELVNSGLAMVVQTPSYNVIIYTSDTQKTTDLTTGLCVRALYLAVMCMAEREPGFYESSNYIVKNGEPIGRVLITTVDFSVNSMNDAFHAPNGTLTINEHDYTSLQARTTTSSPTSTPSANAGVVIDPDDSLYRIRYEFLGQKLPTGDVLNAAFDGLATVALHSHLSHLDDLTAISVSRKVVWHIGRSSDERLLGGEISRAFFLLVSNLFLTQRRFQEVWYHVDYDGDNIADGYVIKWTGEGSIATE